MNKDFTYKDIGQHGAGYKQAADPLAAPLAPKLKLPKNRLAKRFHKRTAKSITLVRPAD